MRHALIPELKPDKACRTGCMKVYFTYHRNPPACPLAGATGCQVDLTWISAQEASNGPAAGAGAEVAAAEGAGAAELEPALPAAPGADCAATRLSLPELFSRHGPFQVVVNTAALSQPAACEKDEQATRAINVPAGLLHQLQQQQVERGVTALLLHMSTDQVYDGSRPLWKETDPCRPVNAYGRSKLEAEQLIQSQWPHSVSLRSSIIVGPQPASPLTRTLFLQFVDAALTSGQPTTFFEDEWRCPVYVQVGLRLQPHPVMVLHVMVLPHLLLVGMLLPLLVLLLFFLLRGQDIVAVVQKLAAWQVQAGAEGKCGKARSLTLPPVLNMGGPDRLSRVDMALMVARHRGHSPSLVRPAPSASVARGVASPQDISMDVSRLALLLGRPPTPLTQVLEQIWPTCSAA
ncbi:hypothetical protein QJQ45_028573 [Haematococcus lacustris]|nr:hypothetical protein QJQ45_028573 [Haematococcus lacustris]